MLESSFAAERDDHALPGEGARFTTRKPRDVDQTARESRSTKRRGLVEKKGLLTIYSGALSRRDLWAGLPFGESPGFSAVAKRQRQGNWCAGEKGGTWPKTEKNFLHSTGGSGLPLSRPTTTYAGVTGRGRRKKVGEKQGGGESFSGKTALADHGTEVYGARKSSEGRKGWSAGPLGRVPYPKEKKPHSRSASNFSSGKTREEGARRDTDYYHRKGPEDNAKAKRPGKAVPSLGKTRRLWSDNFCREGGTGEDRSKKRPPVGGEKK